MDGPVRPRQQPARHPHHQDDPADHQQRADEAETGDGAPRIVFSFGRAPVAVRPGALDVRGSGTSDAGIASSIPADLVLQATGYRGSALPGLPFDADRGTVRNVEGRVVDSEDRPVAGAYVVGWAKRGATGGIGDNKLDAERTVELMLADSLSAATSSGRATMLGINAAAATCSTSFGSSVQTCVTWAPGMSTSLLGCAPR